MQAPPMPAGEQARLAILHRAALLDTPPEADLDRAVSLAAAVFAMPTAMLSLVDSHRQWFKARHGTTLCETPRDVSFCGHVVADGSLLVVEDALQDERFADNPLVAEQGMRFYAGAPLRLEGQYVIGTLCVVDEQPRQFGQEQQQQLQLLADTVSDLLRRRMALQAVERQCERLLSVNRAQAGFLLDRNMEPASQTILSPLLESSGSKLGFIASCQLDPEGNLYLDILGLAQNDPIAMAWLLPLLHKHEGSYRLYGFDHILASALSDGEPLVINQPRLFAEDDSRLAELTSLLAIPCFCHGTVKGLMVLADRPGGYEHELVAQLSTLADTIGSLLHVRDLELARQAAEAELARQASIDPLTGLANRRAFLERCQTALQLLQRYQSRFSVLMLDLDHFKLINDGLGHAAGDYVLCEIAQLLRQQLRDTDQIARWGGEEFCILLPQEDSTNALRLANRLREAISRLELSWHERLIQLTVSIGVADMQSPQDNIDILLARADQALYAAKRAGRNCCLQAEA
ncbi:sensor domain-containing diguanylate cyclase [Vogesella sp. LIG4]|uniref:sensor domain-containing diguanylate cyclase n=1 Tax=Vogesella sp. LIG4 TaxID=1192162 RepID=UPI0008200D62|nr:sensor domain-containing diguanylate cyclase [Vogesella sp. LIG4]SCK13311.1 diguanylate cyclase (GGDEF) domain-containing protein [Vogesella sp. LIG4]